MGGINASIVLTGYRRSFVGSRYLCLPRAASFTRSSSVFVSVLGPELAEEAVPAVAEGARKAAAVRGARRRSSRRGVLALGFIYISGLKTADYVA
jgi:hypothetical protein